MPPRKELCRNFQRGSCQYGDRCKFLHATSQQSKPNAFGFGTQNSTPFQHTNQQQQPNPFGFGVHNNNQSRGVNTIGNKPNQFKPFENKWTRFSPINGASAPQRTDTQPPAAKHTCTNAEVCKRLIIEETEKPQWQLTCYSHYGYGPCDIVGDISFEELRALAYDNAKQGKSLQFIVERERSLLNSKLNEFQNLVQKPYTVPSAPTPGSQDLFAGGSANTPVVNNGFSSQASGFGQLSGLLNTGYAAAPNYTFGELSAFQNNSQPSSSSLLHMNNSPFNSSGVYGNQLPQQSISTPSSFSFGSSNFGKIAVSAPGNTSSTLANTSQTWNASDKPFDTVTNAVELVSNSPKNTVVDDNALAAQWKWNAGEIPEDALPDIHID